MGRHAGLLAASCVTATVVAMVPAHSAEPGTPDSLAPVRLEALHYGDALFHFFQEDYFGSIVRSEAYALQGRLQPHEADAQLLLGGLYLSYGLHRRATEIFRRLLDDESTPAGVRDRAWFHLGKVLYARGFYAESIEALRRAGEGLPHELAAERTVLLSQGLMQVGRFDEAIAELETLNGSTEWQAYGRFNLGVALVRTGRDAEGKALLEAVGREAADTEEMKALRDKANVALAYSQLRAGQPAAALTALDRVRLNSQQSSMALLGAGWAHLEEGRYADALIPWLELRKRGLLDSAVQESYLAVPYAYAALTADRQAANYYEQAIRAYGAEQQRIEESIESIRAGRLLESMPVPDDADLGGWFSSIEELPDAPESRYLYHLLAGHQFQEGMKNHRALGFLARNLASWSSSVDAFSAMVDARRRAHADKLPVVAARVDQVDLGSLDARRDALQARLDTALRSGDWTPLADADELRLLSQLADVESVLTRHGGDVALEDARDRARLARGVLDWRIQAAGKERAWRTGRNLAQLDAELAVARTRGRDVQQALTSAPARNDRYAARIESLRPQIDRLGLQVAAARQRQAEYLAAVAIEELEQQKARLADYEAQARFALAALYGRPIAGGGTGTVP